MNKRFTDAELAAEWWRADHGYYLAALGVFDSNESVHLHQAQVIYRFATLPSYDEGAAA